ncbi:hypothetical protein DLAC_04074 [Tieghemostelium lacteum]|uniref:F-box domain-containing protein n=1 Tax=Tieghemostelium lacteum TaxID=361077 RepID=A0A151ZS65_TIELA|nr:hypothetical protein DLAC_04074 [Tieghemostelium lacteum]|eukprot:KYQ96775.1 hypothetical protein DLAC_04074 [Tieghemostelium lacteum]
MVPAYIFLEIYDFIVYILKEVLRDYKSNQLIKMVPEIVFQYSLYSVSDYDTIRNHVLDIAQFDDKIRESIEKWIDNFDIDYIKLINCLYTFKDRDYNQYFTSKQLSFLVPMVIRVLFRLEKSSMGVDVYYKAIDVVLTFPDYWNLIPINEGEILHERIRSQLTSLLNQTTVLNFEQLAWLMKISKFTFPLENLFEFITRPTTVKDDRLCLLIYICGQINSDNYNIYLKSIESVTQTIKEDSPQQVSIRVLESLWTLYYSTVDNESIFNFIFKNTIQSLKNGAMILLSIPEAGQYRYNNYIKLIKLLENILNSKKSKPLSLDCRLLSELIRECRFVEYCFVNGKNEIVEKILTILIQRDRKLLSNLPLQWKNYFQTRFGETVHENPLNYLNGFIDLIYMLLRNQFLFFIGCSVLDYQVLNNIFQSDAIDLSNDISSLVGPLSNLTRFYNFDDTTYTLYQGVKGKGFGAELTSNKLIFLNCICPNFLNTNGNQIYSDQLRKYANNTIDHGSSLKSHRYLKMLLDARPSVLPPTIFPFYLTFPDLAKQLFQQYPNLINVDYRKFINFHLEQPKYHLTRQYLIENSLFATPITNNSNNNFFNDDKVTSSMNLMKLPNTVIQRIFGYLVMEGSEPNLGYKVTLSFICKRIFDIVSKIFKNTFMNPLYDYKCCSNIIIKSFINLDSKYCLLYQSTPIMYQSNSFQYILNYPRFYKTLEVLDIESIDIPTLVTLPIPQSLNHILIKIGNGDNQLHEIMKKFFLTLRPISMCIVQLPLSSITQFDQAINAILHKDLIENLKKLVVYLTLDKNNIVQSHLTKIKNLIQKYSNSECQLELHVNGHFEADPNIITLTVTLQQVGSYVKPFTGLKKLAVRVETKYQHSVLIKNLSLYRNIVKLTFYIDYCSRILEFANYDFTGLKLLSILNFVVEKMVIEQNTPQLIPTPPLPQLNSIAFIEFFSGIYQNSNAPYLCVYSRPSILNYLEPILNENDRIIHSKDKEPLWRLSNNLFTFYRISK